MPWAWDVRIYDCLQRCFSTRIYKQRCCMMWTVHNRRSLLLVTAAYVTISVLSIWPASHTIKFMKLSWKKRKENAVATCESTSLPPQICRIAQLKLRFCPWDMSNLNCLCTPCVSQQPAAQFSLPLLCMLVLGKSEVVLNQSTSSRKLFFLLCFGIWQMWALLCYGQPWIWQESSRELQGPLQSLLCFVLWEWTGCAWQLHLQST